MISLFVCRLVCSLPRSLFIALAPLLTRSPLARSLAPLVFCSSPCRSLARSSPAQQTIELHSFETKIGFASYPTTDIRSVVPLLTASLASATKSMGGPHAAPDQKLQDAGESQRAEARKVPEENMGGEIRHTWLWPRVGKFFKEHGQSALSRLAWARADDWHRSDLGRDGYIRIRDRQRSLPFERLLCRPNPLG